jgi:hypothetical protein
VRLSRATHGASTVGVRGGIVIQGSVAGLLAERFSRASRPVMAHPPSEDRPPAAPPSVLDYERPSTVIDDRPRTLCGAAIGALALALAAGGASALLGRQMFAYRPLNRLELLTPLLALVGMFVSVHALLRIADQKNRVWGDPIAWTALFLNTVMFLANGCCISMRWIGGAA